MSGRTIFRQAVVTVAVIFALNRLAASNASVRRLVAPGSGLVPVPSPYTTANGVVSV